MHRQNNNNRNANNNNKNNNKSVEKSEDSNEPKPLANWFAEVIELRRRANEYKRRAQGTHFSREHLVQLLAKQTDFWDVDSSSSARSLDALALEPPKAAERYHKIFTFLFISIENTKIF